MGPRGVGSMHVEASNLISLRSSQTYHSTLKPDVVNVNAWLLN